MDAGARVKQVLVGLGLAAAQFAAALLVTFLLSLAVPDMGDPAAEPVLFAVALGASASLGIFLAGWLAVRLGWVGPEPRLLRRLLGTVAGVALPLAAALALGRIEVASPFFTVAMLGGIIGFRIAGWIPGRTAA